MTTSAMFHSDLSISVNKCIAALPQTVTHSSGERLAHAALLSLRRWTPSNGNATDVYVQAYKHTHTHEVYLHVCLCYKDIHTKQSAEIDIHMDADANVKI